MIRLGLTGYPLSHSLSPRLHQAAFQALGLEGEYRLYPIPPESPDELAQLLERVRTGELAGLNVTIPHKQAVLRLVDELSPAARAIGAVNTIVLKGDRLVGENTDAPGFLADLQRSFPQGFRTRNTLVLGAGGAARAVTAGLLSEGWTVRLAVRQADLGQATQLERDLKPLCLDRPLQINELMTDELKGHLKRVGLIVNTTPLGMYPEMDATPWPEGLELPAGVAVYDVVYNPRETLFVKQARAAGLPAASGIGMLVEQAALSFEIWTGLRPPREVMYAEAEVS